MKHIKQINKTVFRKTLLSLAISTTCLTSVVVQAHEFPALDEAYMSIPDGSQASLVDKYHPVFDFTGNSCFPAAAVSRLGKQNGGLKPSGTVTGDCRKHDFLTASNTYHRYASQTINGIEYSAHMYALYFEKDQAADQIGQGHRHDVETVIIYFTNHQPTHVAASAHSGYTLLAWNDVPKEGNHPKIKYFKDDWHGLPFNTSPFKVSI